MAQTKRKRRTKHRGNAAGSIESRGRTGRKPLPQERKGSSSASRAELRNRPPTWKSAAGKAAFGAAMLFALMQLGVLGEKRPVGGTLALCLAAVVLYTPVMYATDRFLYQRRQRAGAGGKPGGKR